MSTATAQRGNPYLRTSVLSASPGELRLMLLDGAIRFTEQARTGLREKNFERVYEGVTRCQAILLELIASLRPEHDPELCERLSGLYTFMYTRLMAASSERNPDIADEVLGLLSFERQTWSMVLEKLAKENASAATVSEIPPASAPTGTPNSAAALVGGIVGGTVSLQG